jgi:hypothetical protein
MVCPHFNQYLVYRGMLSLFLMLGAQKDIFLSPGSATQTSVTPSSTSGSGLPSLPGSGVPSVRLGTWHTQLGALLLSFCIGCFVSFSLAFVVT